MDPMILVVVALVAGLGAGWFVGNRQAAAFRAERDQRLEDFRKAIADLAAAEERAKQVPALQEQLDQVRRECGEARTECARLSSSQIERERAFEARLQELKEAREAMSAQFSEIGGKILGEAQKSFLERADARFRQSEETAGNGLKALLQPVNERLQRYEEGVAKVEAERRDAFGNLVGLIESMRVGQEKVSSEAAKLVNSLRNAPKSRGRWGEQQLKNVLETCGLTENCDFQTEVSVEGEEGRLRPDVVIRIPGGRTLIIDAKVSLNAYQDAFGAVDEAERHIGLAAHAAAMRAHVNTLGNKAYQTQFGNSPDFVLMFVPGEHFLSAALEHDPTLWDYAFDRKVLLATPTNLIAIARSVASVWQQEALARNARDIALLGKELYDRLAKVGEDLRKVGTGLNSAVSNFNTFTNSFNSRLVSTGRKFKELNIETGARELEDVPAVEALASAGDLVRPALPDRRREDEAEAAE
ncbi:DNA recombination protein RmuC [Sphingomonas sp. LY54]|uniref:DNA recombination protein RmuC n=1 Tax=Sphingomonas sp. LY54 TaxID=3095343 RepID=UPI002D796882|nr:DNA recombination protein RmuC [Sphingomonas sp. LY54]WRP28991.1 DNA recombination protein RmuC [Sphingomonas sp. LY54]